MTEQTWSIHAGEVSAISPARHTARVKLPDLNIVTDELPILVPAAVKSHDYRLPEVGETVLVAFSSSGAEAGYILGCLYTAADPVPVKSADVRHWSMEGAGAVELDRNAHSVTIIDAHGSVIKMAGGDIVLQAAGNIHLNPGHVDVPAHLASMFD